MFKYFLGQAFSIVVMGFGIFVMLVFEIISVFSEGAITNHLVMYSVLGLFPLLVGLISLTMRYFNRKKSKIQVLEIEVVKLANTRNGKLSLPEIATELNITIQLAKAMMQKLCSEDMFMTEVTNNGAVIYVLPDYANHNEKLSAQSVE